MPTTLAEEALKSAMKIEHSNKLKFDMDAFIQKIENAASIMNLNMSQCKLQSLPDFARSGYDRRSTHDNKNQSVKSAYQLRIRDDLELFMIIGADGGVAFLSDHWTEESINKLAELAAKTGGRWSLLPSGTPGEIPDHLRAFAQRAFMQHGIRLSDPTPPSRAMIERSRLKYETATTGSQFYPASNPSDQFKNYLRNVRDNKLGELGENDNHRPITPFRTRPKPPGEIEP